jgi:hypothetical protein
VREGCAVEERPFRAASERLASGALAPEISKASDSSEALHHLSFVILSEARRSVAPERESKDPCTLSLERSHQGILTVPSVIELLAVCKRRGTCCRLPLLFVILSAAKLSRFAGVSAAGARRRNPERSEGTALLLSS